MGGTRSSSPSKQSFFNGTQQVSDLDGDFGVVLSGSVEEIRVDERDPWCGEKIEQVSVGKWFQRVSADECENAFYGRIVSRVA